MLGFIFSMRFIYCYLVSFQEITFLPESNILGVDIFFSEILPYAISMFYRIQKKNGKISNF